LLCQLLEILSVCLFEGLRFEAGSVVDFGACGLELTNFLYNLVFLVQLAVNEVRVDVIEFVVDDFVYLL
jgi:hypothetical protein